MSNKNRTLDVVIPISERCDSITQLHADYLAAIQSAGWIPNFIYVLDGTHARAREELGALMDKGADLRIIQLGRRFGEATALSAGVSESTTEQILTLPSYYQIDPKGLDKLLGKAGESDLLLGRRWPRHDSSFNRWITKIFHLLVRLLTGATFRDLGCGVRLIRKRVVEEIAIYGDQHRFLPVLALNRGFDVQEVSLPQSTKESFRRIPSIGIYPRRMLDLLSVFFLVKFTKKPLRFFGLIGSATLVVGLFSLALLVIQRVFLNIPLADRPALLIAALLAVLGVQLFAIGLIGEIVIFTHAKELKEYTISEIVNENKDD